MWPKKNESFFNNLAKQKRQQKNEPVGVFNSVFSYGKLGDSSLTYFLVFVVLYLEIVENIDQMHKSTFCYYQLIETSLMTSSI